jgi:hypothetical protein
MKRLAFLASIGLLLAGCSYTDYLPGAASPLPPPPTATATVYMTPTETATITPTQPTPTFTSTPTFIYPNGRPAPSLTPSPLPTLWRATGSAPALSPNLPGQALPSLGPFASVLMSGPKLYWGSCEPSSITATAKVAAGMPVHSVLIFLRLQDTNSPDTTQWGGGAIMQRQGGGLFTYDLTAKSFEHYRNYKSAWGQYQFVALDSSLHRIGATGQYLSNLTIQPCP